MTQKEKAEMARLGRAWACGRATKAQMLRHTELARKDAVEREAQEAAQMEIAQRSGFKFYELYA